MKQINPTMIKFTKRFAKEQEHNSLYKDMLEGIIEGDFSLDSYLKIYCNQPWKVDNINDVTARLLFTSDVLLKKDSGVKFYRFGTTPRKNLKNYYKKLAEIVDKIIAEKNNKDERRASRPVV